MFHFISNVYLELKRASVIRATLNGLPWLRHNLALLIFIMAVVTDAPNFTALLFILFACYKDLCTLCTGSIGEYFESGCMCDARVIRWVELGPSTHRWKAVKPVFKTIYFYMNRSLCLMGHLIFETKSAPFSPFVTNDRL